MHHLFRHFQLDFYFHDEARYQMLIYPAFQRYQIAFCLYKANTFEANPVMVSFLVLKDITSYCETLILHLSVYPLGNSAVI